MQEPEIRRGSGDRGSISLHDAADWPSAFARRSALVKKKSTLTSGSFDRWKIFDALVTLQMVMSSCERFWWCVGQFVVVSLSKGNGVDIDVDIGVRIR